MDDESIEAFVARITRDYRPGDRVRARMAVYFAGVDLEVEAGDMGQVLRLKPDAVPVWPIEWDRHMGRVCWTSADYFDPVVVS